MIEKRPGDTEGIPSQLWEDAKPLEKTFLSLGLGSGDMRKRLRITPFSLH